MSDITAKDFFGMPLRVNQRIAYPVRQGSTMRIKTGRILTQDDKGLVVLTPTNRTVHVLCVERVFGEP